MKIEAQALGIGDRVRFQGSDCEITELERTLTETRLLVRFTDFNGYLVKDWQITLDNHFQCELLEINSYYLDGGPML
jgi:hypothetical protein